MMYGYYGNGSGIATWVAMALMMTLFWGGLLAILILLLRGPGSSRRTDASNSSHFDAERILHERFARGEIDENEYSARSAALRRMK